MAKSLPAENSMSRGWQAKRGVMMGKRKTGEGQIPKGLDMRVASPAAGSAGHCGLGSGRTKAVWASAPRANRGLGKVSCGLEPECCGHHRKEMTGREGTTEPTELVTDRMWR